jgi:ribosomal protein S6
MEHPRYYETMAIVPTALDDAQVEAIIERARQCAGEPRCKGAYRARVG